MKNGICKIAATLGAILSLAPFFAAVAAESKISYGGYRRDHVRGKYFNTLAESIPSLSLENIGILAEYSGLDELPLEDLNEMLAGKIRNYIDEKVYSVTSDPKDRANLMVWEFIVNSLLSHGPNLLGHGPDFATLPLQVDDLFEYKAGAWHARLKREFDLSVRTHPWQDVLKVHRGFQDKLFSNMSPMVAEVEHAIYFFVEKNVHQPFLKSQVLKDQLAKLSEDLNSHMKVYDRMQESERTKHKFGERLFLAYERAYLIYLMTNSEVFLPKLHSRIWSILRREAELVGGGKSTAYLQIWKESTEFLRERNIEFTSDTLTPELAKHPFAIPFQGQ